MDWLLESNGYIRAKGASYKHLLYSNNLIRLMSVREAHMYGNKKKVN